MYCLAHKNHLSRNIRRMYKYFPDEYDYAPRTWILPFEANDFKM